MSASARGRVRLFGPGDLDAIDWPDTPDGSDARRYLTPFLRDGIQSYVANARADLQIVIVDDAVLPLTRARFHPDNSYVCSPYAHYFAYGRQELSRLDNRALERLARAGTAPLAWAYRRSRFDRSVLVNNWLLSTNLYAPLGQAQVARVTDALVERFPDRPIAFRSVDARGNPQLVHALAALGYRFVFSRQVYYQDARAPALFAHKQIKVDRALYRRSAYELVDGNALTAADAPRLLALYDLLYLEKHSRFNPRFTEAFVRRALRDGWLRFKAFQRDGRIDAALGYVARHGIMTQPFFGYDTSLPQQLGLYRLLSLHVLDEARERGLLVNASAGVGAFKRLRGGEAVLEYNAVYDRHLPRRARLAWSLLEGVLNRWAVPTIQRGEY